jgi:acetate kinase
VEDYLMKTVVLIPHVNSIEFDLYASPNASAIIGGTLHAQADEDELHYIVRTIAQGTGQPVEAISGAYFVVRLPYSGPAVAAPCVADEALLTQLESLVPDAPLHLPRCVELIRACMKLTSAPVIVVSESGFFFDLPDEEAMYAIDFQLQQQLHARRYGFHGIHHRHACKLAARQLNKSNQQSLKVISICLEPRPELAAVNETGPVMVSGGMTPLEGLSGLTACGDVDPGIVLQIVRSKGWDHDRLNRCLGRESGMFGLTGKRVTWDDVFDGQDPDMEHARNVFKYHLLRYCGAAISTLGGIDAIVFSGRSSAHAQTLGPWLADRLTPSLQTTPAILHDPTPLVDLVFEEASDTLGRVCVGA